VPTARGLLIWGECLPHLCRSVSPVCSRAMFLPRGVVCRSAGLTESPPQWDVTCQTVGVQHASPAGRLACCALHFGFSIAVTSRVDELKET